MKTLTALAVALVVLGLGSSAGLDRAAARAGFTASAHVRAVRTSSRSAKRAAVRLLYTGDWSGNTEVYSVDPANPASVAQLTFGREPSCKPADACGFTDVVPSPDGRYVAFESDEPGACDQYASGHVPRNLRRYLYVARADGRGRRRIARTTPCPGSSYDDALFLWRPDSRKLLYVPDPDYYGTPPNFDAPPGAPIYIAGTDGRSRPLTIGMDPAWSPDGRSLAFLATGGVLKTERNGHFRAIASGVDSYAWSPTGKTLAIAHGDYPLDSSDFHWVATIRPDGTGRRRLNDTGSTVDEYVWAPTGQKLALASHTGNPVTLVGFTAQLEIVRPDGTRLQRFTDQFGFQDVGWSSDGRFLSYDGDAGLATVDAASGAVQVLADYGDCNYEGGSTRWSRQGHLLALSTCSGLSVADPAMATTHLLTSSPVDALEWAPDDSSIAYTVATPYEEGDIRVATLSGQDRLVVPASGTAGGLIGSLDWVRPAGPVRYRAPAPRSVATVSSNTLVAPWPIERIAADGSKVVYVSCGHVFVWTPGTGQVAQAEPAASLWPLCAESPDVNYDQIPKDVPYEDIPNFAQSNFDVFDVAIAGDRVALGLADGDNGGRDSFELYDQPLSDLSSIQLAAQGVENYCDPGPNHSLGDVAGAGDLLVFSRWQDLLGESENCNVPQSPSQQIYRLDPGGCPCPMIASSPGPLLPTDVDAGRIAVIGSNATEVLDSTGKVLLTVPVHALAAQLSGSDLVVVVQGQLRDYDATTGALVHTWPLPNVASGGPCGDPNGFWSVCSSIQLELDDAAHGLAAYVLDGKVHVVRLSDGTDTTVATGTTARFMDEGLVYADGADLHLVPFTQLPLG